MENKGVITMQLLIVGDIIRTEQMFDKNKFFSFRVDKVHPIYTKPNEQGEVFIEDIRYFIVQTNASWPTEGYISHHDIGQLFWLHQRIGADGLIHNFKRPQALAQG